HPLALALHTQRGTRAAVADLAAEVARIANRLAVHLEDDVAAMQGAGAGRVDVGDQHAVPRRQVEVAGQVARQALDGDAAYGDDIAVAAAHADDRLTAEQLAIDEDRL